LNLRLVINQTAKGALSQTEESVNTNDLQMHNLIETITNINNFFSMFANNIGNFIANIDKIY